MSRTPILSLGAGVQSSVMMLMAARGELDELAAGVRPPLAVFCDTQWEERGTYEWLPVLRMEGHRGGVELVEATRGDLRADVLDAIADGTPRSSNPPLYARDPKGRARITTRACTRDYKIRVFRKAARDRGYGPANPIECWKGISIDEWQRMKDADVKWASNRYPLIELKMTRADCEAWLAEHGFPLPPKSSCIGCPFHSDAYWRDMKLNRPEAFADAVDFDLRVRQLPGMDGETFVHRSLRPLGEVDLRTPEDRGQLAIGDGFDMECDGACGV